MDILGQGEGEVWVGTCRYLSCPIVSPEPSLLLQPADSDAPSLSQVSRSEADIFTRSLNSLADSYVIINIRCRLLDNLRGWGLLTQ